MLALAAAAHADTADKLAYGKHLSQECTACHRADGRSQNIPPIVGLDPEYFVTTMRFYRTGQRYNPVMNSVAMTLTDEQLDALAAYLTTLKPPAKQAPARKK
jgi:cytochrome c